jgi:hypothetical protein
MHVEHVGRGREGGRPEDLGRRHRQHDVHAALGQGGEVHGIVDGREVAHRHAPAGRDGGDAPRTAEPVAQPGGREAAQQAQEIERAVQAPEPPRQGAARLVEVAQ